MLRDLAVLIPLLAFQLVEFRELMVAGFCRRQHKPQTVITERIPPFFMLTGHPLRAQLARQPRLPILWVLPLFQTVTRPVADALLQRIQPTVVILSSIRLSHGLF